MDSLAYPHFALLYVDDSGKLRFEASSSILNDCHRILSPDVTHSFLRAVNLSGEGTKLITSSDSDHDAQNGRSPLSPGSSGTPNISRRSSISQKRASHERMVPMSITCYPKTMLPVRNQSLLRRYYEKAFDSLQQTNCRILAKAYIKLVEPRKQVNYPYNGRKLISGFPQQFDPEETKPAWWPVGVIHREPDHLRKPERIRLLVHILCGLRESHAICVNKLKEADQSIRRQISPVERLQILDEVYRVRGEEENYLDGKTDSQTVVCISHVHLPGMADPQPTLYTPSDNAPCREEILDLESHISAFPSSHSPASDISISQPQTSTPPTVPTLPTAWDVSTSLPPIQTALKPLPTDGTAPYTPHFSSSPLFPHHAHEPTGTLGMPPFAMEYYTSPHSHLAPPHSSHHSQGHFHPLTSAPLLRPATGALGGCSTPFYFGY